MYIPEVYEINDQDKVIEFIENNNFGDLVTFHNQSLCSNKVPFFFDRDENILYGHFGRSNPQLIDIEESSEVLAIFSGAHAYISPHWYESQNMVPTWNFQTLQIRGVASIVKDNCLIEILEKLSAFHESEFSKPWAMDEIAPERLQFMLKMIVGFKIEVTDIKFKEKMSQNRSVRDQQSVIDSLNKLNDPEMKKVANIMSENLNL